MADESADAPPEVQKDRPARAALGLALLVIGAAIVIVVPPLLGQDSAYFATQSEYLRVAVVLLFSFGALLTFSAFFHLDLEGSLPIPGLKDSSVKAVGAILAVSVLGFALYKVLPALQAERAKPDPLAGIATLLEQNQAALLAKIDERGPQNLISALGSDKKVVEYDRLLTDMLTDKDSPLKLQTHVYISPESLSVDSNFRKVVNAQKGPGIVARLTQDASGFVAGDTPQVLRPVRHQDVLQEAYFVFDQAPEEDADLRSGIAYAELDPATMELNLFFVLSGKTIRTVLEKEERAQRQSGGGSVGGKEVLE
ncbi:hypothetical protein [Sagittula sp. S175]|uniref:hypothetical protein n=1 Tax=Sagittula sp. S175 TaxID=3415129 RepID=UPI003C7B4BBD